jgi:hypothetical protein
VQSKHMLNTNEHWINAIDFIGTFEISIFESWQNTHFNTTPNYIHKHVNHDLAIFCRVFSFQIAYLWKHKSCTQEDNLVTSALCTMCKETEVKFLITGQESPKMEMGRKRKHSWSCWVSPCQICSCFHQVMVKLELLLKQYICYITK